MAARDLKSEFNELKKWSASLQEEIAAAEARVFFALDATVLGDCPSHASNALMELRGVRQRIEEVQGCYQLVCEAISRDGKKDIPA